MRPQRLSRDLENEELDRPQPLDPWEPGVMRQFGLCDLGDTGQTTGWAAPEQDHAWNDGMEAVMHLALSGPRAVRRLQFEGTPFLGGERVFQDLTLYANGFRIAAWRLTERQAYRLEALIEPEQLFERENRLSLCLAWHLPLSTRPVDVGVGSDTRLLGFCFRSMSIGGL